MKTEVKLEDQHTATPTGVAFDASSEPMPVKPEDLLPHETYAFECMREWKRSRARELGFNDPCVICHNRTLVELVRRLPEDLNALGAVWGISAGGKRQAQHGEQMLAALAPFRSALLAARSPAPSSPAPPSAATDAGVTTRKRRRGATASSASSSASSSSTFWCDDEGEPLAANAWRAQREAHGNGSECLPTSCWSQRRRRCALIDEK